MLAMLGTCFCCITRRRRITKGKENYDSFLEEVLREEEENSVCDVNCIEGGVGLNPRACLAPPSPSIFSQGDFLMEDIGESAFTPGVQQTVVMKDDHSSLEENEDNALNFSCYKMPRSGSMVGLCSVNLDSPVLSLEDGQEVVDAVGHSGDGGASNSVKEGGWLFYSIMREIHKSSKIPIEDDEVFNASHKHSIRLGKTSSCDSIDIVGGEETVTKKKKCEYSGQVGEDDSPVFERMTWTHHPLEVKVVVDALNVS